MNWHLLYKSDIRIFTFFILVDVIVELTFCFSFQCFMRMKRYLFHKLNTMFFFFLPISQEWTDICFTNLTSSFVFLANLSLGWTGTCFKNTRSLPGEGIGAFFLEIFLYFQKIFLVLTRVFLFLVFEVVVLDFLGIETISSPISSALFLYLLKFLYLFTIFVAVISAPLLDKT